MSERDLFIAALQKDNPAERAAYLSAACGSDADLRRRIERLLRLHADAGSFLEQPAVAPGETVDPEPGGLDGEPADIDFERTRDEPSPLGEGVGASIGPYKLVQKLGEGGMGVVWVAEQHEPVKRRVALKVIKPGMDSARILRRFEAERQALALMDHRNIAKVFDGGQTPCGRPYFVMELVKGVPITRYCDELHLSLRERLELFVPVCQAIQHAAPEGHHPPRHQARQRADGGAGRQADAQGDRLRRGQGAASAADRPVAVHRDRASDRHAGVHGAGAG